VADHAVGAGKFITMLSRALLVKLDGILGYNFLSQFEVTVDYPRNTLESIQVA
jgi:hypothetical protein